MKSGLSLLNALISTKIHSYNTPVYIYKFQHLPHHLKIRSQLTEGFRENLRLNHRSPLKRHICYVGHHNFDAAD